MYTIGSATIEIQIIKPKDTWLL